MSKIFLVVNHFNLYLFSEKKFYKFIEKNQKKDWIFFYGDLDSNAPLKSSHDIKSDEIKILFDLNKIKPLLKYKMSRIGSQYIYDTPYFSKNIYLKYGERRRISTQKSTKK